MQPIAVKAVCTRGTASLRVKDELGDATVPH
jgi:hypothetical protein